MKIGYRIKDLRARQRATLKDLAQKTGLTTSFLSQLERDLVSPSIRSLEKIAEALNSKIGYFFEREEGKELIFVKKRMGKKAIEEGKGIAYETFASGILNIKMQPHIFTLGAGAELRSRSIFLEEQKFGMVIKGKVELLCDSEKLILEEGDGIYCAYTQKPKSMINIGETEAVFLWIVFTPH